MKSVRIRQEQFPDTVMHSLANRDVALWLGDGLDLSSTNLENLREFISLPWKMVLCESNEPRLIQTIQSIDAAGTPVDRRRGFVHVVASDPEGTQLPPRALPVFLLSGRRDAQVPEEAASLGRLATTRRRLNMINQLVAARPRTVILVSAGREQPLADFFALWKEESFRSLICLVSSAEADAKRMDEWLGESGSAPAVDHCESPLSLLVPSLAGRLKAVFTEDRLIIRMRNQKGSASDVDITQSELIERPLLDRYDLIRSRDLSLLQPDELAKEEFDAFFTKSSCSWKPYSAGLPWPRDQKAGNALIKALETVAETGPSENCICSLVSEPGAGGTTMARMLAFEAATLGYPVLLARQALEQPDPLEVSSFLHRVHVGSAATEPGGARPTEIDAVPTEAFETPWLIVFDVAHWEGRSSELRAFLATLTFRARPVVILTISGPEVPFDLSRGSRLRQLSYIKHELEIREALNLGKHLNKFLRKIGREKTENEWRGFWENHRPDHITSSIAHFWIALGFWLKGQLDMEQSIQNWLYASFRDEEIDNDTRLILLEIAALSIERQPLPEGLMPPSPSQRYPYSVLLEDIRSSVPALALIRESVGTERLWAMAHDLLGRYLVTSTFFDRKMMEKLRLTEATDPVELRLLLLKRVISRPGLALKPFRRMAIDFAVKVLKLDADGNQEFVPYWRKVLDLLNAVPAGVREVSRTFNHHVAISLRRVAKQREFEVTLDQRSELLYQAVRYLEFALNDLEYSPDEETNINLLNSLALAYQDLADVEREKGTESKVIIALRTKATETTLRALQEDPGNSYVLETSAKNLIQNGELHPDQAISSAAEALGYIYQAVAREQSEFRQTELTQLANRALNLLRSGRPEQLKQLNVGANPFGVLAEAWLVLTEGIQDLNKYDLADLPQRNVSNALSVLENAGERSNWMILRFRYDLLCASRPADFSAQLRLLDELEGTGYRMPLQIQLEQAILLHQEGRSPDANRKFRSLRREFLRYDTFVDVPPRLTWLRIGSAGQRRICEARVVERGGYRPMARVTELKGELAPFIPQDFGAQDMPPGHKFKCLVSFGRNGPFLRPARQDTES
ncbi:hypothetical protein [Pedosphaera parvula]|uniref:Inactive Sirtuin domain-containing protein n=1 Tax=Pedosphaera parvula (strain Ellin514) TaxID=320771 RepID=B9XC26_PEDPL|nr:hypothetical protein [Pedosphaera parvula]EEF62494.1 hypothetical protein Cflav_PD5129 [Pedosphaera parvula Ellin514]